MDMNTQLRLTGMATGLDTDAIIKNLGRVNTIRVDAVKRDRQTAVWRQETLRSMISTVQNFQKSNLNTANPASNFRSPNAFAKFTFNLAMNGLKTDDARNSAASKLSVTANGDLKNFNQSVQAVAQLATRDTYSGESIKGMQGITGSEFDIDKLANLGMSATFNMSIDGVSRTVRFTSAEINDILKNNESMKAADPAKYATLTRDDLDNTYIFQSNQYMTIGDYLQTIPGRTIFAVANEILELGGDEHMAAIANPTDEQLQKFSDHLNLLNGSGGYNRFELDPNTTPEAAKAGQAEAFVNALNTKITELYGKDYQNIASLTDGKLMFNKTASNISISSAAVSMEPVLEALGFPGGGASSASVNNKTIGELFAGSGIFSGGDKAEIAINGELITLNKTDTISTMLSKVNGSKAGVTLSYNSANSSFSLTSKEDGSAGNIQPIGGNAAKLFSAMGLGDASSGTLDASQRKEGQNLIAVINGVEFTRPGNTFTYEGMTYTFHDTFNTKDEDSDGSADRDANGKIVLANPSDAIKIEVGKNTSEMISSIKAFVDEYNSIVDQLNDLISSKKNRDYQPLSDDERKAMSEEEIKLYEDKAKLGILGNDSDLRKLLDNMRQAIYTKVEGVGISMADIGITTGSWQDKGRLVIEETKLNSALENKFDEVVALFTKNSSISDTDMPNRNKRISESGIANRLNDILNDAVRTTAAGYGSKGYLIERAGMQNDGSVNENVISKQIGKYDDRIQALLERWYRQEDSYYAMFARMETAMAKMQSQQSSLAQLMGGG